MDLPIALGEREAALHGANDWDLRAFSHEVKLKLNILEGLRYFLAGCPEGTTGKDCCVKSCLLKLIEWLYVWGLLTVRAISILF